MPNTAAVLSFTFALMGTAASFSPALTQEEPGGNAAVDYAGVVIDPRGAPAVGCSVWLVRYPEPHEVVEEAVTDGEGRFTMRTRRSEPSVRGRSVLTLVARDRAGRLGGPVYPQANSSEATLQLLEVTTYRGRLVNLSGEPIAKATIEPLYVLESGGRGVRNN